MYDTIQHTRAEATTTLPIPFPRRALLEYLAIVCMSELILTTVLSGVNYTFYPSTVAVRV